MLDRDAVLDQALGLLDEVGHEKLTMRRLADRLGTYPNVVYWHVGNRERLLAQAVDRALSEVHLTDPGEQAWGDWLATTAREVRRVMHLHPGVAPLIGSRLLVSPSGLVSIEAVLRCLAGAGFRDGALVAAYNTFVGSVLGWISLELAAPAGREGTTDPTWQKEFRATVAAVDPTEYPTLAANRRHLADHAIGLRWHGGRQGPLDDAFDMAVDVWVKGLERSPYRHHQR